MSIALALSCSDGLMVCADQEFTDGKFISYAPKITRIQIGSDRFMLLAQAGLQIPIAAVAEQAKIALENQNLGTDEVRQRYQNVLARVIGPKPKYAHQTLVALPEEVLWQSQESTIVQLPRGSHSIIGVGEQALAHYLLNVLLGTGSASTAPNCLEAFLIGLYIVLQTKKFVPDCGAAGPTDAMFLSTAGTITFPYSEAIAEIEDSLNVLDQLMGCALRGAVAGNIGADLVPRFFKILDDLRRFAGGQFPR